MVDFAPSSSNIQENPEGPNYFHYLQRTTPPEGSKAGLYKGEGMAALAKGVEGAATGYESGLENMLQQGIYRDVDAASQQRISELQGQLTELQSGEARLVSPLPGKGTPVGVSGPKLLEMPTSITGATQLQQNPWEVQELPKHVEAIVGAKKTGKISNAQYDMQIRGIAQRWRAAYPAHVKFIDETISRSAGSEMANKTISALMSDVNSYAEARNAAGAKSLSLLAREDVIANLSPEQRHYFGQLASNGQDVTTEILDAAGPGIAHSWQVQLQNRELEQREKMDTISETERKHVAEEKERVLGDQVYRGASIALNNELTAGRKVTGSDLDFSQLTGPAAQQLLQRVQQIRMAQHNDLNLRIAGMPGMEEGAKKRLHDQIDSAFEFTVKALADGDGALVKGDRMMNEADTEASLLGLKGTYPLAPKMRALDKQFPHGTPESIGFHNAFSRLTFHDRPEEFAHGLSLLASGTGAASETPGEVTKAYPNISPEARRQNILGALELATDKKIPPNIALQIFGNWTKPGNWTGIQQDYTDPVSGETILGQDTIWSHFYADPKIRARARELGPAALKTYNQGLINSLGQEVWQKRFEDLRNFEAQGVQITYDDTKHEWGWHPAIGQAGSLSRNQIATLNDLSRSMNIGMKALEGMAEDTGSLDPELFAVEVFAGQGFNLTPPEVSMALPGQQPMTLQKGTTPQLPQRFVNALVHSKMQKNQAEMEREEELSKKMTKGLVEGGGS